MAVLPEILVVGVTADGHREEGLLVLTRVMTADKNDFWAVFGPSDADGTIRITRDDLLREAGRVWEHLPDDYVDPERDFTGAVHVMPLDRTGVDRAIGAYEKLRGEFSYPAGYRLRLHRARRRLDQLQPKVLQVDITTAGGDATVEARPPL